MRFTKISSMLLMTAFVVACTPQSKAPTQTVEQPKTITYSEPTEAELKFKPILSDIHTLNEMTKNTIEAQVVQQCGKTPALSQIKTSQREQLNELLECRKSYVANILPERKNEISETRLLRPDITDEAVRSEIAHRLRDPANLRAELAEYAQNNKAIINAIGHLDDMGVSGT